MIFLTRVVLVVLAISGLWATMDQEEIYNGYYEDTVEVMAELRVTGSIEAGRRIPRGLRHAH